MTMLDAVYVDSKENAIVAIKPKAPFKPVFEIAMMKEGSEVNLVHDPEADFVFVVETGEGRTPRPEGP